MTGLCDSSSADLPQQLMRLIVSFSRPQFALLLYLQERRRVKKEAEAAQEEKKKEEEEAARAVQEAAAAQRWDILVSEDGQQAL